MLSLCCGAVKKFSLIFLLGRGLSGCFLRNNYSCSGSGTRNWHTAGDWAPNGIPGAVTPW